MKIIEITVDPQGKTKIETKGFSGMSCIDASKFLEHSLGQRTGHQMTAEAFAETEERQRENQ